MQFPTILKNLQATADRLTTAGEQVTDTTAADGSSNAAEVDLELVRSKVDVFVDASGSATLTVEASTDGQTWREIDTEDYASATTDLNQYDLAYRYVRAYLSQNTTTVEVVGRGL